MKNTFAVLLLMLSIVYSDAQTTALDSSWVVNQSGIFFQNRLVQDVNGESQLTKKRLGDTTEVLNSYKADFISQTSTMASDIGWTSTFTKRLTEFIRQDNALTLTIGRTPSKSLLIDKKGFVDSTYNTKDGSKVRGVKFSVTQTGNLRYKIDTFTTRGATLLGKAIRLNNYLNTGDQIDLYEFPDGRWRDGTRTVQLYLASVGPQSANREVVNSIFGDVPVELPITYEGGLVHVYGKWIKYDAKKKKWVEVKPIAGIKPLSP